MSSWLRCWTVGGLSQAQQERLETFVQENPECWIDLWSYGIRRNGCFSEGLGRQSDLPRRQSNPHRAAGSRKGVAQLQLDSGPVLLVEGPANSTFHSDSMRIWNLERSSFAI